MAAVAATGNGPFEFTNSSDKLVSIPLTALSFDASGNLVVNSDWQKVLGAPPADALLKCALAQGLITAAPTPSPKPAAIIKAAFPGQAGNNLVVTIPKVVPDPDPTKTTFDIIVTETENYVGLTAATVQGVLGTAATAGSQPGLVHVSSVANPSLVPANLPKTPLASGSPSLKASLLINDGSSTPKPVFTLEARDLGADGNLIQITITSSGTTFSLTAKWEQTAAAVKSADFLSTVATKFGYQITALAPSGGVFSAPSAGATNLSGGTAAISASAILVASQ